MQRRQMITWMVALGAGVLGTAAETAAQSVFRAAPTYALAGTVNDATELFALIDVGSQDGPLDHIADVVVAEQNQFATVLFGNGDGTFSSGPNTALGRIPSAMVVADFDGDHIPDLLIGDATNTVAFFKGTGSADLPPFQPQGDPIRAGDSPVAIETGDVNRDGKLDALVIDEGNDTGTVTVLLGNGDGTFRQLGTCATGPMVGQRCGVDSDCGDGVICTAQPFPAGKGSAAGAVADFNADGKLDVAVANKVSNDVTILRGAGNGFFTTVQTIPVGDEPIAIAAHDLNGDGRIDLVVTNRNSDNIAVVDGLANGTFGTARFFTSGSVGSAPTDLALADVNHDGKLDVLAPNNRSSDASVLLGDGHGNFGAPRTFVTDQEPLAIAGADVDGDGNADAVVVNRGGQGPDVAVLISRGDGGFDAVEDIVSLPSPGSLVAGDVDNDGISDLILAHTPVGTMGGIIYVYRAIPPLGFAAPVSLQSDGDAAALGRGDFNGDGLLDIAVINHPRCVGGTQAGATCSASAMCPGGSCPTTGAVSVFLGDRGGGFGAVHNFTIGSGATALAVGDWNHDGRSDLAVTRQGTSTTGSVDVLLAAPDGSFGIPKAFPVGLTPVAVDVGDFNDDGVSDLVVASNTGPFTCAGNNSTCRSDNDCGSQGPCNDSGDLTVLMGVGDGTFHLLAKIADARGPKAIAVADFDRDHHDDIAVARAMDRNAVVYFGDGLGNFTLGPSPLPVDGSPSALAARDISGDSIPDLLVSDEVSNAVALYKSLGNRRFRQSDVPPVSRRPISMIAADFDGDGRYDGAAADNFVAGAVSVLTNIVAPSASTPAVLRGDGNGDTVVSAADAVAVMRELGDGNGTRIEEVQVGGSFAAKPGVDANGDGVVTPQDALAVAHRLFPEG